MHDVVIVGAGPVGGALALALADADLDIVRATNGAPWLLDLIYAAAQRGGYQSHFYATEGPKLLDVAIDGSEVVVKSSPVMKVIMSAGGERYECRYGMSLTETRLPLDAFFRNGAHEVDPALGTYFRITVVDARGKRAWTNPIWLS